ncbi:hypothetical protein BC830DRAFT_1111904 [Chytriomyces sp. MP71]|nr:hypothetical protein BC830DRAFT_1111904 [Chytriomyces sp. MP71]
MLEPQASPRNRNRRVLARSTKPITIAQRLEALENPMHVSDPTLNIISLPPSLRKHSKLARRKIAPDDKQDDPVLEFRIGIDLVTSRFKEADADKDIAAAAEPDAPPSDNLKIVDNVHASKCEATEDDSSFPKAVTISISWEDSPIDPTFWRANLLDTPIDAWKVELEEGPDISKALGLGIHYGVSYDYIDVFTPTAYDAEPSSITLDAFERPKSGGRKLVRSPAVPERETGFILDRKVTESKDEDKDDNSDERSLCSLPMPEAEQTAPEILPSAVLPLISIASSRPLSNISHISEIVLKEAKPPSAASSSRSHITSKSRHPHRKTSTQPHTHTFQVPPSRHTSLSPLRPIPDPQQDLPPLQLFSRGYLAQQQSRPSPPIIRHTPISYAPRDDGKVAGTITIRNWQVQSNARGTAVAPARDASLSLGIGGMGLSVRQLVPSGAAGKVKRARKDRVWGCGGSKRTADLF